MAPPDRTDTIVAPATPPGRGGIGIVRLSGPRVPEIAGAIAGPLPAPRVATLRTFRAADGAALDTGLVLWFPAPASFTGEPVLELHGHGGPVVMDLLVRRGLELGARLARPGEFTERAFLNGRLDLAQAEAVADLIDAGSAAAARAALRSLAGEFSARVHALGDELAELRTWVEASIDFADEDLELLDEGGVAARLARALESLAALARGAAQGRLLHEGLTLVIAGRPNAGKSSLLNALAGHEAAIVTELPGTTRDVVRERIDLEGLPVAILDTAGLREEPDRVEAEGIRRAHVEMRRADRILYVVDAADAAAVAGLDADLAALPADVPVTIVANKADVATADRVAAVLERARAGGATGEGGPPPSGAAPAALSVSARTGAGLEALRAHLAAAAGWQPSEAGTFAARRRHLDALARSRGHLAAAAGLVAARAGTELVAEELKLAHAALGEITGEFTSEDLLGRIFATFCIGK